MPFFFFKVQFSLFSEEHLILYFSEMFKFIRLCKVGKKKKTFITNYRTKMKLVPNQIICTSVSCIEIFLRSLSTRLRGLYITFFQCKPPNLSTKSFKLNFEETYSYQVLLQNIFF